MQTYFSVKEFSNYKVGTTYCFSDDQNDINSIDFDSILSYQDVIVHQTKALGIVRHQTSNIEGDVHLEGNILLAEGVKIMSGTRIKGNIIIGKNTTIGNNCLIRGNCSIGEKNKVGFSVDIKNSITGNHTYIGPLSFIGDSLFGDRCSLGANVRTSNFRLDKKNIQVYVSDHKIDTGHKKFGCIVGDDVSIGIHCVIYPGRLVRSNTIFEPGIIIDKNYPGSSRYKKKQELVRVSEY